jgi:hypothetical protein
MRHAIIVCSSSISPLASGWFICVNIALIVALAVISTVMSGNSLNFKMLTLEVIEKCFLFPEVLKG